MLQLLSENVAANTEPPAAPARVSRLVWGSDDPLASLGLATAPDLVLASDVVRPWTPSVSWTPVCESDVPGSARFTRDDTRVI